MALYNHNCENEECEAYNIPFQDKRPMSECEKEIPCPVCNKITYRMMSIPAFHLKGGGWYRDGYGTTDVKGRPLGNAVSATSLASSTASKTHKK